MEKSDSLATVAVKAPLPASECNYPDNESFTTEPPPAYRQPRSTAVQVARIVAVTVIAASAILGACLLASAWIQARATCELMVMEHQLREAELRMHSEHDRPQFQALTGDASTDEEVVTNPPEQTSTASSSHDKDNKDATGVKLPLQIDFDDIAGSLIEKSQRAHMNCVVEKRRSEELVDHAPRALTLPFGLNLTTPPRLEHLTGERMVITCSSEQDNQRQLPMAMSPIMVQLPGPAPSHHHQGSMGAAHPAPHQIPEALVNMIVTEHHRGPQQPLPIPLMALHQQQQDEHVAAESRGFAGIPIPIHIRELTGADDEDYHPAIPQGVREGRGLFPGVPVQVRQINVHEESGDPEPVRPHYVQPRSVPSDPAFLHQAPEAKRVKRCACNCDC